jgi:hypothetical protein
VKPLIDPDTTFNGGKAKLELRSLSACDISSCRSV